MPDDGSSSRLLPHQNLLETHVGEAFADFAYGTEVGPELQPGQIAVHFNPGPPVQRAIPLVARMLGEIQRQFAGARVSIAGGCSPRTTIIFEARALGPESQEIHHQIVEAFLTHAHGNAALCVKSITYRRFQKPCEALRVTLDPLDPAKRSIVQQLHARLK